MKNIITQPMIVEMQEFKNLFIELTSQNCNQRCKICYIDFPKYSKKIEDFIKIDVIKQALEDTKNFNLDCIYLTGAEPMTHPDFNAILRLCLRYCNVCICTNASFINEKKARFLKKVEEESDYEIIFKISMTHFNEIENDEARYRGAYRHSIFALKHLLKYEFNPIINFTNYYNLSEAEIYNGFTAVFNRNKFELDSSNIQISAYYDKNFNEFEMIDNGGHDNFDCKTGRILTSNGIYSCPFLANDYRGRCGSDFGDFNTKSSLETSFCNTCNTFGCKMFSIDFSKFS